MDRYGLNVGITHKLPDQRIFSCLGSDAYKNVSVDPMKGSGKEIPVTIKGSLEHQFHFPQDEASQREVCVFREEAPILYSRQCWNGYVHVIGGCTKPRTS